MENVLFKISFPAEFHAQAAIEAALTLRTRLARVDDIDTITIQTHEACIRIIDKQGPLKNPADRDHCIQYMVAIPLLFGRLTAADYEDEIAADPRIDALRARIRCIEHPPFTDAYLDPERRAIPNRLVLRLHDGTTLEETVKYPIGHRRRRAEGVPLLDAKFERNLARRFPAPQQQRILAASTSLDTLQAIPVDDYISLYLPEALPEAAL